MDVYEAYNIVKEHKENTDGCIEFEKGFLFTSTEDSKCRGGWGHTPVAVLKKDGSIRFRMDFCILNNPGEIIRQWDISSEGKMIPKTYYLTEVVWSDEMDEIVSAKHVFSSMEFAPVKKKAKEMLKSKKEEEIQVRVYNGKEDISNHDFENIGFSDWTDMVIPWDEEDSEIV